MEPFSSLAVSYSDTAASIAAGASASTSDNTAVKTVDVSSLVDAGTSNPNHRGTKKKEGKKKNKKKSDKFCLTRNNRCWYKMPEEPTGVITFDPLAKYTEIAGVNQTYGSLRDLNPDQLERYMKQKSMCDFSHNYRKLTGRDYMVPHIRTSLFQERMWPSEFVGQTHDIHTLSGRNLLSPNTSEVSLC